MSINFKNKSQGFIRKNVDYTQYPYLNLDKETDENWYNIYMDLADRVIKNQNEKFSNSINATDYVPKFNTLQPDNFNDFIGQFDVKKMLLLEIAGVKRSDKSLRHILLYGRPGLGKTTLAKIIAKTMDTPFFEVTASGLDSIDKMVDLINKINTIGKYHSVLFIDEIHLLKKEIQTHIYSLMTDNRITLTQRNIVQSIPVVPMTIIGATNYMGALDEAFRSRFPLAMKLVSYGDKDMQTIIAKNVERLNLKAEDKAVNLLSKNCQSSPRIAENLLVTATRVTGGEIFKEDVIQVLRMLKIYPDGLNIPQVHILMALARSDEGNLGIHTLSKIIGEDVISINEEWETYLLEQGYVAISKGRGREITAKGIDYLKQLLAEKEFKDELEVK